MVGSRLGEGTVRMLRIISIVLGLVNVAVSVFAETLGLSKGSGFSANQVLFLLVGLFLVIAGIMGRRFPGFYRGLALVVLNLAAALVLVEMLSLVCLKTLPPERMRIHWRKVEEGHLDVVQRSVVQGMYAPFVVWRSNPLLNCETVTVSPEGFRMTSGASDHPDALKVFLFGGSAMWGTGVPDEHTIGCFLQELLSGEVSGPVCVHNYAQTAHSSTQEVIELMLQLRSGNIPHLVVFYDGFNDIWGGYESGAAGGHHSQEQIAARVEGRTGEGGTLGSLAALFHRTNTFILVKAWGGRVSRGRPVVSDLRTYHSMGISADSLAAEIVETYRGNSEVALALSEVYGFRCLFVWQPSAWSGSKVLTDFEEIIRGGGFEFFLAGGDPAFEELYRASCRLFEEELADGVRYHSFIGLFDDFEDTVYSDYSGAHLESHGNQIAAGALSTLLLSTAFNE